MTAIKREDKEEYYRQEVAPETEMEEVEQNEPNWEIKTF